MKILVPILVVSLLIFAVIVGFKFRESKSAQSGQENSLSREITGDPDQTVDVIEQSSDDIVQISSLEDEEAISVNEQVNEVSSVGDVYNEGDY